MRQHTFVRPRGLKPAARLVAAHAVRFLQFLEQFDFFLGDPSVSHTNRSLTVAALTDFATANTLYGFPYSAIT